jgi:hypothetical protein
MVVADSTFTVRVPLTLCRRGGRKLVVAPEGGAGAVPARVDSTLVKALARAFRWRRMLESGRHATVKDLAAGEKINASYVSRVLRLTLLAPDLIEAILDGRGVDGLTLPALMEPFPGEWTAQRAAIPSGAHASRKDGATHPAAGRVVTRVIGGRA